MKPTKYSYTKHRAVKRPAKRTDNYTTPSKFDKSKWDMIFGKMKKLGTQIEMYFGDQMNIDNLDYRWVNDRIEYYEAEDRLLTHQEMKQANLYWKKYGV